MWLFTSKSFVSIVVDKNDPNRRLIRSRRQGDIEELFPEADVFIDETADYRYRAFIPTTEVTQKVTEYMEDMDYTNFKDSIPSEKNEYHDACIGVWGIMMRLQKGEK